MESKIPKKRIPSLDGLRAISILMVLLGHSAVHFVNNPLHQLQGVFDVASYLGVTVFFVISGYLITNLLIKEWDRNLKIKVGAFFRRRAVRILPASFVYIAVISAFGHSSTAQKWYAISFTTTYFFEKAALQFQHLWSLSVEEQFYLLWPLVFAFGKQTARRYCWAVMVIAPLMRVWFNYAGLSSRHCFPTIADSIAAGCLLGFYEEPIRRFSLVHLSSTWRFAVLFLTTIAAGGLILSYSQVWIPLWGMVPCLIALCVIVCVQKEFSLLNSKPFVAVGLLSYSLYLWQQPFLTHDGRLNYLAVRLPLAFLAAYLSYRFVETPMLRFRQAKKGPVAGAAVESLTAV